MSWKFEFIKDPARAFGNKLMSLWLQLPQDHVFNSPWLIKAWFESFSKVHHIDLLWVVGTDEDGNRSLWPLVIWHRNWKNAFIRIVMPAGGGDYDYHSPMFLKPASLDTYFHDLTAALLDLGGFDEINFSGLPDESLPQDSDGWLRGEVCPMLHLSNFHSEDDLMKFFSTSLRGDLRRQWRRLSEVGEPKLLEFHSWKEVEPEFDAFMNAHASRWPNAYKIPGFHRRLLQDDMLAGPVSFTALKVGDKSVAWHLGFRDKQRFYYYMPAGNPDFMRFSPVKVHLWRLVSKAIDDKKLIFDHLRGDELYKGGWSNAIHYEYGKRIATGSQRQLLISTLLKLRSKFL